MKGKHESVKDGKVRIFFGFISLFTILFGLLAFTYAQSAISKNKTNYSSVETTLTTGQSSGLDANAVFTEAAGVSSQAQLFVYGDSFGNNCLPRRANGHFIISLGSVLYFQ